ncbi:MAG: hypothetical protein EBV81_06770 [Proteobacteria bacterium]|nr:hypothetical protein [Candidatus Fonsibacter sp. PEL5]
MINNKKSLEAYTRKLFEAYIDDNYKEINYCKSDLTRHLILLKTIEYSTAGKELTFEHLVDFIPAKIASRSHKINCINELCEKGILKREENINDKRSKLISPTKRILDQYSHMHQQFRDVIKLFAE